MPGILHRRPVRPSTTPAARPRARRTLLSLATGTLAVLALSTLAAPSATAASGSPAALQCVKNQTFVATTTVYEHNESWRYAGGGKPTLISRKTTSFPAGTSTVVITTCKDGASWVMMSPLALSSVYDGILTNGSSAELASGRYRGFGAPFRQIARTSATITPLVCSKSPINDGVTALLGLPLPYRPDVAIGVWLVGTLIPEASTHCYSLRNVTASVGLNSSGRLSMTSSLDSGYQFISSTNLGDITLVHQWQTKTTIQRR